MILNYKLTGIKEVIDVLVKLKEHMKTSLYQVSTEKEHMVGGSGFQVVLTERLSECSLRKLV